jgi:hypothetical protein
MNGTQSTLNESGVNQIVSGIVNADAPLVSDSSNTFHDLDDKPDAGASSAADDKKASDDEKAAGDKKTGEKGQEGRFDKDPDWQRMKEERDTARKDAEAVRLEKARLEGKLEAAPKPAAPVALPYKDISALTAEQIREWQEDDPKGFAENLKIQARYEAEGAVRQEMNSRIARENEQGGLKKTYDAFETSHPDFRPLWDSGEIIKFIEKNPGHNPMSAYQAMTFEKKVAEAVEKAKKETEEEVTKRFQAKRKATVLSGGAAGAPRTDEDPAFQNTKDHGGRNAVLANKLAEMRRAGGK